MKNKFSNFLSLSKLNKTLSNIYGIHSQNLSVDAINELVNLFKKHKYKKTNRKMSGLTLFIIEGLRNERAKDHKLPFPLLIQALVKMWTSEIGDETKQDFCKRAAAINAVAEEEKDKAKECFYRESLKMNVHDEIVLEEKRNWTRDSRKIENFFDNEEINEKGKKKPKKMHTKTK
ncbi:hypothetical protein GVAV_000975 [Gurleya vavrai]